MFYEPKDGHGLPHNPFNALITPRPIGWISTRAADGSDNLAPYSFFNGVAYTPPQVMFSCTSGKHDREGGVKDSVANIIETGVFCVNVVEYAMAEVMNQTSGPWDREVDEFADAGIEKAACTLIDCPRVATAPANLECRLTQIVKIEGEANTVVFGEVIGVHMRDDCLVDGIFDARTFQPVGRMGYRDFTRVTELFTLRRPGE
jgi:flavin reductase (DIM6/NTAB) family NADH-FMN oxidoreductase RutF